MGIWDERGRHGTALDEGAPNPSPREIPAMADLTLDDASLYLMLHERRESDSTSERIALQTPDRWMRLRAFDARRVGLGSSVAPSRDNVAR